MTEDKKAPVSEVEWLRAVLKDVLDRYTSLVNSGDCGHWDPEKEPTIIAARQALIETEPVIGEPTVEKYRKALEEIEGLFLGTNSMSTGFAQTYRIARQALGHSKT